MPIALSRREWNRICKWNDPNKEDPEIVRRRDYIKFLNETSSKMTRDWPNSLENVNRRNEELRRERLEAAEQANTKFYKKYVKRQKDEQERLMYSARDTVFKSKDAPKLLLSAVIETVIQKERMEQLKFEKELKKQADERKKADDDETIRQAKEWNELMALKKQRRFEANKQHQRDILEQAKEVEERKRMEYETELNMQKIDNIKAKQQMDAIKEFEDDFKSKAKARFWSDMEQAKAEVEASRREQRIRDQLADRLQDVLQRAKARVHSRRERTEKETKEEKLRVLEKISQKLESGDSARDAKEQANLNKAVLEKLAIEESRNEANRLKKEKFREERVRAREQYIRDEQQRTRDQHTMKQWELMNRFKNNELYDEYKEKMRQEKQMKINQFRDDMLMQWRERDERSARELAETRHFYGELAERKIRLADNKLLIHGGALLEEAKRAGRPTYPIEKALDHYCKLNRLYPMPPLPKSLQAHFKDYRPWDGTQPDPWYKEPPPPAAAEEEDKPPRDGIQHGLTKSAAGPSTSKPADQLDQYEKGRADGLQQKIVTKIPCQNTTCNCELRDKK